MIGGYILDTTALVQLGRRRPYVEALVWTAVSQEMVLAVPAAALAVSWSQLTAESEREVLRVTLGLPEVIVEPVDVSTAEGLGKVLAGLDGTPRLELVQTLRIGMTRDWPILTADGDQLQTLVPGIRTDDLP